jgi:hypothetical protein
LYQALLADASLPCLLLQIDLDLAAEARTAGCRVCGATLHSATFPRKVRGGPWRLGDDHDRRLSFSRWSHVSTYGATSCYMNEPEHLQLLHTC